MRMLLLGTWLSQSFGPVSLRDWVSVVSTYKMHLLVYRVCKKLWLGYVILIDSLLHCEGLRKIQYVRYICLVHMDI